MLRTTALSAMLLLSSVNLSTAAEQPTRTQPVVRGPAAERLHRYLQWAQQFGFSGVVLLALDGQVVLHQPYGLADRSSGVPNRIDSVFSFGSIAKQFTAAAIMKLAQQGRVSPDDSIAEYFDHVPDDKRAITIHQLLTHTSGLIDYHGLHDFQKMDRDTAVQTIFDRPLLSPPGTEFAYSNSGYTLTAAIVELVSKRDFAEYMQEEIFEPAGMHETGFMGNDLWDRSRVARIYRGTRDNGSPAEKPGPFWVLLGNGGVVSTVGQMYQWDRTLRAGELLSPQTQTRIFTPDLNEYGYGWDVITSDRGTTIHAHDGGSSLGLSAQFTRYVDEDGALILASNATIGNTLAIDYMVDPLSRLVFSDDQPLAAPPQMVAESNPGEWPLGTYAIAAGEGVFIYEDAGQLFLAAKGQAALSALDPRAASLGDRAATLNATAAEAIAGVLAGDLDPLASALTQTEEPQSDRAERWARMLRSAPKRFGEPHSAEILGTTQLESGQQAEPVTWIRLQFDQGQRVHRLHWSGDKIRGLGGDLWPYAFYGPLRFESAAVGRVFDFRTGRAPQVRFEADADGRASRLALETPAGVVRAVHQAQATP